MRADELRASQPLRRPDRRPAQGADRGRHRGSRRAWRRAVPRGRARDFWWVLVDGAVDLVRHIGREDTVVGKMDVPGRWAGGFRAWDEHGVYLATGRGAADGRVLRVPAEVLRDRFNAWFPFGRHLIQGLYHTARSIESTARQRESLATLGRLAAGLAHEINNPAAAAARAVDALEAACQTLLSSLGRLAQAELWPSSSPPSTRCAGRSSPRRRSPTGWLWPTTRRPCRHGLPATASLASG